MEFIPLFSDEYLFSHWEDELGLFKQSRDAAVRNALLEWNARDKSLTETQLDGLFVQKIFEQLWGYWGTGTPGPRTGYTLLPQYAVGGAGQTGGTGKADLALAHFGNEILSDVPQVLCEFKDIKCGLDTPQNRKGNDRSPVQQCLDYLKHAFDKAPVNSTVMPTWGIVTDMNEFRLYHRKTGSARFLRFVVESESSDCLISDSPEAIRQRFLFCKVFSRDFLLAPTGRCGLEKLLQRQWIHEKALENHFYKEYQAYRQHVYEAILEANPEFSRTRGELVRITQRFLDRCIFLLFCEDMGKILDFPTDLLRDILIRESISPTYSPEFDNIWSLIKHLLRVMRDGGLFPPHHEISRFNGGLFDNLDDLESLRIPNRIFCAQGQGANEDNLRSAKNTLLYLSANYNFGTASSNERTITLYTLGRIFEQSITDLEYMHAEADGTPTIAKLSKRKRDGVYYTPEWITGFIVQEVVGRRLSEERERVGFRLGADISEDNLLRYQRAKRKPRTNPATVHLERLERYQEFVNQIRILDPACGSGAFLIQSLQYLLRHHRDLAIERERVTGQPSLFDQDAVIRNIVTTNLFGVDINPESVEITQLALWLNTAVPKKPLSTLTEQIRCGNSLVDDGFRRYYQDKYSTLFDEADLAEREVVNTFNWEDGFPAVMGPEVPPEKRGFDCIIGNPPYVKLQHFRKAVPDVAEYLVSGKRSDSVGSKMQVSEPDAPLYMSTQTKNFDLYLPFIERGVSLLHQDGHMGYIAPNVWLINEYGEGLRKYLVGSRRLERWIDFRDFPVFDEAMTYTALQFFRGSPTAKVAFSVASDGELSSIDEDGVVDYETLVPKESWVFLPDRERQLIERLRESCVRLDEVPQIKSIFQGVITSADYIYHLERIGPGRYLHQAPKKEPEEVALEDSIMRPLLSGAEAKRYQSPKTDTYILFPYDDKGDGRPSLISTDEVATTYPNAWSYLRRYETELRQREHSSFDDEHWFRFGRNQNIDKQRVAKLGVAQTVPEMRVFYDTEGIFCINNVRVNGILVEESHAWFILGILNSRVADFVFRRTAKPKEPRPSGAYFEANKQYIAPIPVPNVSEYELAEASAMASALQSLHSKRRDLIEAIDSRLSSSQMREDNRAPSWIWAEVRSPEAWVKENPKKLRGKELKRWAKTHHEDLLDVRYTEFNDRIDFGQTMLARCVDGELKFYVGQQCVIDGVYVNERDANVILPQWQQKARGAFVSEALDAKRIVARLLNLRTTDNEALIAQLAAYTEDLEGVEERIIQAERKMDDFVYSLYGLTGVEREIVEVGTEQRVSCRIPRLAERAA